MKLVGLRNLKLRLFCFVSQNIFHINPCLLYKFQALIQIKKQVYTQNKQAFFKYLWNEIKKNKITSIMKLVGLRNLKLRSFCFVLL